ncbi:MAG: alpha-galactosidase, partial [Oscillospiraceae bacterium]|nr:alpha-galactosidase [Oscillospiraceae bacterium]
PEGMGEEAALIHEAGYLAGLWLAPFVAETKSAVYREHPDWFLRVRGEKWYCGSNWSGFYSLDIDNPEVQDYLRRVFDRVLHEWGFDLVKLDFLYGAAPFGTREESRAGRMIRAMDFLRELCGDKLILGCGVPLWPAFGKVDYCRIGCDVGLDWNDNPVMQRLHRERISTLHSLHNTIYRRQLSGRAFGNDPDVFFLREDNLKLTEEQKGTLATVNALFGSVLLTSDDPSDYSAEQLLRYQAVRQMREAQGITVDNETIRFTLNGKPAELGLPR